MGRDSHAEQIPEALPADEIVYILPADAVWEDDSCASWAMDVSPLASALGYVARILFFVIAPFCVVMSHYFLSDNSLTIFILATMLFAGVLGRSPQLIEKQPWLMNVPLVRDILETLNRLHAFYLKNEPRWFLFYMFYPISCPLLFLFSRTVRKEFRLYAGIFVSVTVAMLIEFAFSYSATYPPHLGLVNAIVAIVFRLFLCLVIFAAFFIPVTTTSFRYHLSCKPWRMRMLVVLGLLSAAPVVWITYFGPVSRVSFWAPTLLSSRMNKSSFRVELKKNTEMFLLYHGSRLHQGEFGPPTFHSELTEEYRRHISGLAVNDEVKCFDVFTAWTSPTGSGRPWLGVRVCTTYSPAAVAMVSPDGQFYSSWEKLPSAIQRQFRLMPVASAAEKREADVVGKAELIDDLRE
jgi:hypothetical protein